MVATNSAVLMFTRPVPPRVVRMTMTPSGATALGTTGGGDVAISPDGTRLAYIGAGQKAILVRALDELQPTILPVGAAYNLFFSPDGQWIGFDDGAGALKKIATTGGPPITLSANNTSIRGASWSSDDTIIFGSQDTTTGLLRVAAAGGDTEVLTRPNRDQGEYDHYWPEVLPGGQAVLFTIATGAALDNLQVAVLDLRTRAQRVLIRGGSHARYVPTGHLVYGVAGTLRAVAFDLSRLEVVGTPVPALEQVMTTLTGAVNMSVSTDGTLVFEPGGAQPGLTLVWVDRQGREEPLKAPPSRDYSWPRLSPDGTRLAVRSGGDIWIWDLARQTPTRLTLDAANNQYPVWSPDGRRVVFRSQQTGQSNLFWQAADGIAAVERLTESPNEQSAHAFSPDGTRLVFREDRPTTGADLMLLTLDDKRRVEPLVQTPFTERNPEISPDGRWLAYQSDESGQFEIYVRPFPNVNDGRRQISTDGGTRPLWARNGKELFYLAASGAVMSVPVEIGSTFSASNATRLFEGPYFMTPGSPGRSYDVSADGQRFLMIKVSGGFLNQAAVPSSMVVVQNWFEELKRLVPVN